MSQAMPMTSKRSMSPGDLLRVSLVVFVVFLGVGTAVSIETQMECVMGGIAILCAVLAMLPMFFKKNYCAFEPMTVVLFVVLFSVTAKTWMVFTFDNTSSHVQRRLLLGADTTVLFSGLVVMLAAIAAFCIGYLIKIPRFQLTRFYMVGFSQWNNRRLLGISILMTLLSVVFFLLFVKSIGFQMGDALSAKRFVEEGTGSSNRMFDVSYYFYRLAAISKFAFYLTFVDLIAKRKPWLSLQGLIMAVAGLQSMLIPLFLNNRAGFALLVVDIIVMLYFLRPRLVVPAVMFGGVLVCVGFLSLLAARKGDGDTITVESLVEESLGGRDLMDITKTAHIVNAVPDPLEYRYGETLWGWMAAPIPSSLWPNKPMWSARGPFLMHIVYGDMLGYGGLPPGLVAELYWNLGWFGVITGMFVMGVIAHLMFAGFFQYRQHPSAVLIYAIILNRLILFSLGNDIGTGIIKATLDVVPLMFLIFLVAKRPPKFTYGYYALPETQESPDVVTA